MKTGKALPTRPDQTARAIVLGMLCALPALLSLRGAAACVADPDLGWHLRTAEWILSHHAFPHTDPFSRLSSTPWQAYSWLFELILLKLYRWFSLDGFVIFTAGVLLLVGVALYRFISRLQADFTKTAVLVVVTVICMCRGFTPRPWLFTILFFILELDILMRARQTGRARGLLWLPLIFALWVNIHIQFMDGLLVLGIAACEPLLARWWKSGNPGVSARSLWLTLAACMAATCINPYGAGIYKVAWDLASQSGVLNTVVEMQALPFRNPSDFLLLFVALAAAGVLARGHKFPPFETLMFAAAAVISFRSQRDVWFMATTAAAILAVGLPSRVPGEEPKRLPVWALPIAASATAAILAIFTLVLHVNNAHLKSDLAEDMPVQAVEAIRAHHYAGPVFNDYGWGGFLIWNLRQPVTIDGRAALYGDQRIQRNDATWGGRPDWASNPDLASAGVVIGPADDALMQLLRTDKRFQLAYHDKIAAVFVSRVTPMDSAGAAPGAGDATVAGIGLAGADGWRKDNENPGGKVRNSAD